MPESSKRVGETRTMNNGWQATIISYRNARDMDVQFDNGEIREHVSYGNFKKGNVAFAGLKLNTQTAKDKRIGETKTMNCGRVCKIIEYHDSHNITIQFDDGVVLSGKYYTDFSRGTIKHPSVISDAILTQKQKNTKQKSDRVGTMLVMSCGMPAICVEYNKFNDIKVQFEDGEIHTTTWALFKKGSVSHSSVAPVRDGSVRMGETKYMNNGLRATIIRYDNYDSICVEFEDNMIVDNIGYRQFAEGTIAHPNIKYKVGISLQEFAVQYYLQNFNFVKIKQGEWKQKGFGRLELDLYNDDAKVAIEIDGGHHATDENYKRDVRKNNKCAKLKIQLYRLRVDGLPILPDDNTIVLYMDHKKTIRSGLIDCKNELEQILKENNITFNADDIDFIRDANDIVRSYNDAYINYYAKKRLGERVYSKYAKQYMTIIGYDDATHITVQFEDGSVRSDVTYSCFHKGEVAHPNNLKKDFYRTRVGESNKMKNGMLATIVAYHSSVNVDLEFEDGTTRCGIRYGEFKKGQVAHENDARLLMADKRIGEVGIASNGMNITIVVYRSSTDIDIQFEDGFIRKHVSYADFQKGYVRHRNMTSEAKAEKRLGESKVMNNGMAATIVEYRSSQDVDVEFEDGATRCNVTYASFNSGSLSHPHKTREWQMKNRVGEIRTMSNGQQAQIIKYRSATDMDIKFLSDNTIVANVEYGKFKLGYVKKTNADSVDTSNINTDAA